MSINWNNLRSWNGSQEYSFEELCSQLAAAEHVPEGARFFRKGTPDAGVECFWQLPNGDEWAWQAKFFRSSPGASQWQQLDKSIQVALDAHPQLMKYTICLPIDLPDERKSGRISALQKWDKWVAKWEQYASRQGRTVSFEYWGQSQIATRLSVEKNRGRHWFWFSEERFSNAWFVNRVNEAVANARDRYTPELNIDVPIRSIFDALGRTPEFYKRLNEFYIDARIKFNRLRQATESETISEKYEQLTTIALQMFAVLKPWLVRETAYVERTVPRPIPWNEIAIFAQRLSDSVSDISDAIYSLRDFRAKDQNRKTGTVYDDLDMQLYHLREFHYAVDGFAKYSTGTESRVSDCGALLLLGTAGQGKTHLLCDVAKRETDNGRPRLVFHGEQFQNDPPWGQMTRLLGIDCSQEEFLGALEAAAQANNCRVLIFIDALNEGEGNRLWMKFLPGVLATLGRSPWLGICITVRSSYEEYIIPKTINQERIVRVEHHGFSDVAYEAATRFFQHFGIEPSTPVLLPEFDNPLFLKLFCQSLQNAGLTRVPPGLRGITSIFDFFIESIDEKLAHPEKLDYDKRDRIVAQAVNKVADEMAQRSIDRLPLDQAKSIVNALLPGRGHLSSLFYHLTSESILTVVPDFERADGGLVESVRFAYQRFSDHLITKRLLARHLNIKNPKESFSVRRPLGKLVKDEHACWANRGILEALAVQIPELTGRELPNLVPHLAGCHPIREAFVEGLAWRTPASYSRTTYSYINKHVLAYSGTDEAFWNAIVALSTTPNHPLNADRMHQVLIRLEMPDRDAWWSVFLHKQWGLNRAVDRLVEWAWQENDKSRVEDEVIRLGAITLAWFFTTANRFLRDRATKAMVRLCENRIPVLRQVMATFANVNDPYVSERLYAVAYGCSLRTKDTVALASLAQDVYRWVFDSGEPPPHILLRDYARGVIEASVHRGATLTYDVSKIRPPYRSDWPSFTVPELSELKTWGEWKDRQELAKAHLYHSIMGEDDFSRYVISDLHEWSSRRINEPQKPTKKELHDKFVKFLTDRQRNAWTQYCNIHDNVHLYRCLEPKERSACFDREFTDTELDDALKESEANFLRMLGKSSKKREQFREAATYHAEPYVFAQEDAFDSEFARRWMLQRVINFGWTLDRFSDFDGNVNTYSNHGRAANKPERIGKKYQWIAYHELHARLSDNFEMKKCELSDGSVGYQGAWDGRFRRDIDPSNLLRTTEMDEWRASTETWWFTTRFDSWDDPSDEVEWLKNDNVPCIKQLIEVTDPQDGAIWMSLNGYYSWQQPTPPGEERYELKRRELWYMLKGYIVKKKDFSKLFKWAKRQNWMGRWMPESHETHSVLLGEFFWAPAFKAQDSDYYGHSGWNRDYHAKIPVDVMVANDEYGCESGGYDCSLDHTIFINLPCRFLADGMALSWQGIEGNWYDSGGQLVAFDPSVRKKGPRVLLFRRDALIDYLDSQGLAMFWTLLGEKRTIGGPIFERDYKGHREINGAYALKDGKVLGEMRSRYTAPRETSGKK